MPKYEFYLASSLEKVFPNEKPKNLLDKPFSMPAFLGTRCAVQLVYFADPLNDRGVSPDDFKLEIGNWDYGYSIRKVDLVPSDFPCYPNMDEDYLQKEAALYPDLLSPLNTNVFHTVFNQYRSLWLTFFVPDNAQTEKHSVSIKVKKIKNGETGFETSFIIDINKAKLEKQKLLHTEWFHSDCLASYYNTEVFSYNYWLAVKNFINAAVKEHSINMILCPIFTPPLDTDVGGERPTVQLVDISLQNGDYIFEFSKLRKWLDICRNAGVLYIETAHFFTQWGAKFLPKIYVKNECGVLEKRFGWHTPALNQEYKRMIEALVPKFEEVCAEFGYTKDKIYYHISDEPSIHNLENYKNAKELLDKALKGKQLLDALSSLDFYKLGLIKEPICANDHIQGFYDSNTPNLWVYYCCAQSYKVPNRFFAMPSYRNRIMGVLMYLYNVKGFLHWGYNFYFSQYSRSKIDPYYMSHANYAFPSGDGYLVYPGDNFIPLSSIRAEVQYDAFLDVRLLQSLESKKGREYTLELIKKTFNMQEINFFDYPRNAESLLELRQKLADELNK